MKKIFIYTLSLMLVFSFSCKKLGKSSLSKEEVSALILEKQDLEKRVKTDSANYEREMSALRMEYEQKLAQFEKANQRPAKGFFVVVGSFKEQKLADSYASKIKSMGYEGNIVDGPGTYNCVTSATFGTLKESLSALQTARNSVTPEAWIYIK